MAKAKKQKTKIYLDEYPDNILDIIKLPEITKDNLPEWIKKELEYLSVIHKYDTLRSECFNTPDYKDVPVYSLYYAYLKANFDIKKAPLNDYAKGYKEGFDTANFTPYIDTPENRKEVIVDTLNCDSGFPISLEISDGKTTEFLDPQSFFEYGRTIGKQRRAWDIVLENKKYFSDFLENKIGGNYLGVIGNLHGTVNEQSKYFDNVANSTNNLLTAIPNEPQPDPFQFIKDTLKCLGGLWENRNRIMREQEFKRLNDYVIYIAEHRKLPETILPITTPATNDFIKHTIYLIYKNYRKQVEKKVWCEFLHKTFEQFKNVELSTTNSKLSSYYSGYNITYETLVERLQSLTINNLK